ncbi:MAG: TetR/AcrR family transcriptional regulator [Oscillospiraceae bacterium]|nr:TetR/AcrR family transcriptional regulator [Oscillospiraceae bacterium]
MPRKPKRNTKGRIISAAWKLFYEQGYEDTTLEDILEASETSRGTFYHYFEGKDALLGTLSDLFDEKYRQLLPELREEEHAVSVLAFLNRELFAMIDSSVSVELLARLLSTQLITKGEKHLLDRNRLYFRLLRTVIARGQSRGELRADRSVNEIVKAYALMERGLMYDWCLCSGEYSLSRYSADMMEMFLKLYAAPPDPDS